MAHAGSLPLSHGCLPARLCLPGPGLLPAGEGGSAGDIWVPPKGLSGKPDSIQKDGNITSFERVIVVGSYYLMMICQCHFKNSGCFAFYGVIYFFDQRRQVAVLALEVRCVVGLEHWCEGV